MAEELKRDGEQQPTLETGPTAEANPASSPPSPPAPPETQPDQKPNNAIDPTVTPPADAAPSLPSPAPEPAAPPASATTPNAAQEREEQLEQEARQAVGGITEQALASLMMDDPAPAPAAGPAEGVQLGRIEAVRGDDVFIALDGRKQGVLSIDQFGPDESRAVGEPVEVIIDRYDRESDIYILARKGQARAAAWGELNPGDIVEGHIVGLNRGGLEVQLKGIKAFMPASHVDVQHVKDISIFLNEHVRCVVMDIDRRNRSLTVSRRKLLERERKVKREELLEELDVGQVRKVVVGNITEFGAFADLGGVDGLIHISDMSYRQIKEPGEVLKTGDVVEVKVLKIQDEKGKKRISLGLKQIQPDPWHLVADKYPPSSSQRVRIVRIADFGAFAELEEGIEGLIPVSEMSWSRIGHPKQAVSEGQIVDVTVLRVEPKKRRIALSMKHAQPDPWTDIVNNFTPESQIEGKVTRLADFGVFVEIAPGVEGMVHISELADRRVKACSDVVKVGQQVNARILRVDPENRRIGLSLKPAADSAAAMAEQALDLGKAKQPRKKDRKLRGGLSSDWDWAGAGLDQLPD